jgi:tRNA (guanine-N7-)-methyltransferase
LLRLATPGHRRDFSFVLELTSEVDRLDLEKIFGRIAPLHVDLGCGDGTFLCAMAEKMPEKNFLGIERLLRRVRSATKKAAKIDHDNVRVLRVETFHLVRRLLPPGSVEAFYLLFPDPWPKRRHHRRRIVTAEFLNAIADALVDQGTLQIATDQADYFDQIRRLAADSGCFTITKAKRDAYPSTFEAKFEAQGVEIHRLSLRKVSGPKRGSEFLKQKHS